MNDKKQHNNKKTTLSKTTKFLYFTPAIAFLIAGIIYMVSQWGDSATGLAIGGAFLGVAAAFYGIALSQIKKAEEDASSDQHRDE